MLTDASCPGVGVVFGFEAAHASDQKVQPGRRPRPGFKKIYASTGPALILVRPDGYIAAIDRDGQSTGIKRFLGLAA
jgi:hypothetical protein